MIWLGILIGLWIGVLIGFLTHGIFVAASNADRKVGP